MNYDGHALARFAPGASASPRNCRAPAELDPSTRISPGLESRTAKRLSVVCVVKRVRLHSPAQFIQAISHFTPVDFTRTAMFTMRTMDSQQRRKDASYLHDDLGGFRLLPQGVLRPRGNCSSERRDGLCHDYRRGCNENDRSLAASMVGPCCCESRCCAQFTLNCRRRT
jgi:hypothetical protein